MLLEPLVKNMENAHAEVAGYLGFQETNQRFEYYEDAWTTTFVDE